jgi:hypothetical protein
MPFEMVGLLVFLLVVTMGLVANVLIQFSAVELKKQFIHNIQILLRYQSSELS